MKLAWLPVTGTCDRGTSPGKQSIGRPLRELRTCYSGERKSSQSLDLDIMEQNEALAANELGDHVGDVEGKQIETLLSSRFWRLFVSNEVRSVDRPFRCKLFLDLKKIFSLESHVFIQIHILCSSKLPPKALGNFYRYGELVWAIKIKSIIGIDRDLSEVEKI